MRRGSFAQASSADRESMAADDSDIDQRNVALKRVLYITCWYITSGITLFGNKHILNTLHVRPTTLGTFQMVTTAVLGCGKVYLTQCLQGARGAPSPRQAGGQLPAPSGASGPVHSRAFLRDMLIVGSLRFVTVVAGLLSLKFVAVSFTETIKSSAPFFTVVFAWMMLREPTSVPVALSLIPVVGGLALCSATELSFNLVGFWAAVFNNGVDCVQNVYSKKLLTTQYTYVQLQFYTSAAALIVQLPFMLLPFGPMSLSAPPDAGGSPADVAGADAPLPLLLLHLALNGVSFHMQSVMAYAVMSVCSPVTQSVLNTLKRALLIWLSILWFGNPVTAWSALGTLVCVAGVFLYNYARQHFPPRAYAPLPTAAVQPGGTGGAAKERGALEAVGLGFTNGGMRRAV